MDLPEATEVTSEGPDERQVRVTVRLREHIPGFTDDDGEIELPAKDDLKQDAQGIHVVVAGSGRLFVPYHQVKSIVVRIVQPGAVPSGP